jgi:Protein of unknown function (DUF4242)
VRTLAYEAGSTDTVRPPGATAEAIAEAHARDLDTQGKYGVEILQYWFDEEQGKVFGLVQALDAGRANAVQGEAHGLVADEIFKVEERT